MSIDCKCLHCLNLAMGDEITKLRRERDEARRLAGVAEMRLKKAEEVVMLARQLTAYSWVDRLEDCKVSDDAKHDSRELGIAVWLYDQDPVTKPVLVGTSEGLEVVQFDDPSDVSVGGKKS